MEKNLNKTNEQENTNYEGVGKAFEELSMEEMAMSQGSGEIQPRTTFGCMAVSFISGLIVSKNYC